MPGGRVRILAGDEDPDLGQGLLEGAEDVLTAGAPGPAGGLLLAQEFADLREVLLLLPQDGEPGRMDEFFEGLSHRMTLVGLER